MESVCVMGKIEGRRGRVKFLDSLAKAIGGGHLPVELLQMTDRRADWRSMVANVLGDMALQ